MYDTQKFGISPIEDIGGDLAELFQFYPKDLKRVFLVNGDAFALQAKKLFAISDLIHEYFPEVECITCYALIKNIKQKSDEDLKKLRQKGFNEYILVLKQLIIRH